MVTLGIESSAQSASASVVKDGIVLSEMYLNVGLTHSVTLMPLIKQSVESASLSVSDIDCVAVSNGPGSFTGIRIGVATAKGIAQPDKKKCVPVPTLEAIAYPLSESDCIGVSVMDARCQQVYCSVFDCNEGLKRLTDDEAVSLDTLYEKLLNFDRRIVLIGDGTDVAFSYLENRIKVFKASSQFRYQRASSVALIGEKKAEAGESVCSYNELVPSYLRLPQAERELKKKKENL